VRKHEELKSLGDLCLEGRIILKKILEKYGMKMWTGFNWLRLRPDVSFLCY
jgi:hypothetical protein